MLGAQMDTAHRSRTSGRGYVLRLTAAVSLGILLVIAPAAARGADPTATPRPALADPIVVDGVTVPWQDLAADGTPRVHLYFGWTSTCPHCAKARPFVADLARQWPWLVVHSYQLDGDGSARNGKFISDLAGAVGGTFQGVPIFVWDARTTTGFDEVATTGAELRDAWDAYHRRVVAAWAGGSEAPQPTPAATPETVDVPFIGSVAATSLSLPLVTVVLAGLDSVNPCALAVLLFLLGVLVGTRSRRRMLAIGSAFVLVSGLSYFVFMAAWLNVFLLTGGLGFVTAVAGVAAIVAALVNVKDFVWFRRGPSLVIPESAKPRIFGRMIDVSDRAGFMALFAGTVLVAVVANLYEALCTGGFPLVFTRILTLQGLSSGQYYLWLGLYSVVYVLPLLGIVVLFTATLGRHTVTITEARRLKLLSGLLMLCLGVLLVLAPERLNDLATSIAVFGSVSAVWLAAVLVDRRHRPAPVTVTAPSAPLPGPPNRHEHRPEPRGGHCR